MKRPTKRRRRRAGFYAASAAWIAVILVGIFPVWFVLTGSFMGSPELNERYQQVFYSGIELTEDTKTFLHLFPSWLSFDQYYNALLGSTEYLMRFWNSMILLVPILAGQLLISAMTGYAMAKLRFPGKKSLTMLYMLVFLMPVQVTLLPNFLVLQRLGLIGSRLAVILPAVFNPFGTFWLCQFARKLPDSTLEMARVEGAGEGTVFTRIALPQMMPAISALGIMTAIDVWSMVEQPLTLLQTQSAQPLSVTLASLAQTQPTIGFAYCTIYLLPLVMLFLMAQEHLVDGISDMMI